MRRLIKRVLLSNVVSYSQSLFNSFKSRVLGNSGVVEADSCAVTTLSNLDARNLLQSATFVLAPSGYKSGVIYSQVPSNGNGDLTITRATTATRVNSSGLIESVASGVPQLDYSLGGCPNFLFEPQRRNLLKYSQDYSQIDWGKTDTTVNATSITSPDGTITGNLVTETLASGSTLFQSITSSITTLPVTLFFKYGTQAWVRIQIQEAVVTTNNVRLWVNLQTGVLGTSQANGIGTAIADYSISIVNGWYKVVFKATFSGVTSYTLFTASAASDGSTSRGNAGNTRYEWGKQIEDNGSGGSVNYPTSYIPTTSAAVTRNATNFTRSNIYTNGLIGASGGTWFLEFKNNIALTRDSANAGFGIKSNSDNNGIYFRNTGTTRLYLSTCVNGTNILGQYQTTATNCKIIIKWDGTLLNAWENGTQVITNLSFSITNMELINGDFSLVPNYISQMALWNTPLSDAQCIALTS